MELEIISKTKNEARFKQIRSLLERNAASYQMRTLCYAPVTKNLYNPCKVKDAIKLGAPFLRYSFDNADFLMIVTRKTSRTRSGAKTENVVGFATIKSTGVGNTLYVDAICALAGTGQGTRILREVAELARKKGRDFITLSALPHVIPYYEKLGFKRKVTNPRAKLPPCSVIRPGSKICEEGCPMFRRADTPFPSRKPAGATAAKAGKPPSPNKKTTKKAILSARGRPNTTSPARRTRRKTST